MGHSLRENQSFSEPAQFGNAGLVLVQDGIAQCPTNPNQEYVTGQSHAFFIPLVTYTNFGADKNIASSWICLRRKKVNSITIMLQNVTIQVILKHF